MFNPTRNSVVNSSMVGKEENSSGVLTYIVIIMMAKERARFAPMSVSTSAVGMGMIIRAMTATNRPTSARSLCLVVADTMLRALENRLTGALPPRRAMRSPRFWPHRRVRSATVRAL